MSYCNIPRDYISKAYFRPFRNRNLIWLVANIGKEYECMLQHPHESSLKKGVRKIYDAMQGRVSNHQIRHVLRPYRKKSVKFPEEAFEIFELIVRLTDNKQSLCLLCKKWKHYKCGLTGQEQHNVLCRQFLIGSLFNIMIDAREDLVKKKNKKVVRVIDQFCNFEQNCPQV